MSSSQDAAPSTRQGEELPITGSGDPDDPVCFGRVVDCAIVSASKCDVVLGCSSHGECVEVEAIDECEGLAPRAGCESVPGCGWNSGASRCSGNVEACESLSTAASCSAFASCEWNPLGCVGSAVTCAALSVSECETQPGCTSVETMAPVTAPSTAPSTAEPTPTVQSAPTTEPVDAGPGPAGPATSMPTPATSSLPTTPATGSESPAPSSVPSSTDAGLPDSADWGEPRLAPVEPEECTLSSTAATPVALAGETNIWTSGYPLANNTACLHTEPRRVCMYGVTEEAGSDFANWGTIVLLEMSYNREDGQLLAPWDATVHGIVGLRFRIDVAPESNPMRFGVGLADSGNELLLFGGGATSISTTSIIEASWDDFEPPSWANDPIDLKVDPTRIAHVTMQSVASVDTSVAYNFCLSDFEWLDAQGNPVPVEPLQAPPSP